MSIDLTDEEFVQRLIENGWSPEDAAKELQKMYDEHDWTAMNSYDNNLP